MPGSDVGTFKYEEIVSVMCCWAWPHSDWHRAGTKKHSSPPSNTCLNCAGLLIRRAFLNKHTVGPPYPISLGFASMNSTHRGLKTVFLVRGWEWWMRRVYCTYHLILCKGLEHPWILVPTGVVDPIPRRYRRTPVVTCLGTQKSYTDFRVQRGWATALSLASLRHQPHKVTSPETVNSKQF